MAGIFKPLIALAARSSPPRYATTLIDNVNGIQIAGRQVERFRALLTATTARCGTVGESLAQTIATVDRRRRPPLLPGLIDAPGHVMALGQAALRLDLTGT